MVDHGNRPRRRQSEVDDPPPTPAHGPRDHRTMPAPVRHLLRHAVAVPAVALAVGLKLALDPWAGQSAPFLLFLSAVVAAAWLGGLGPGLLATGLATAAVDFFFFP